MITTATQSPAKVQRAHRPTRQPGEITWRVVLYILLVILALVFFVPLYWLYSSSIKSNDEILHWPLTWIPQVFHWQNYPDAFTYAPFARYLFNSVVIAVIGTAAKLALAVTTAYAFVFLRFPFKDTLFLILLAALMVPGNVSIIVNYLTVSDLGWVNTYAGLIVPGIGSVFGTFLLRQHMRTIPRELVEAAEVDGAGHLRRLVQIVAPVSKPMIITITLITLIDDWNGFVWPLIITNTESMRTLPIGVYFLKSQATDVIQNWGVLMAGTVVLVTPMLIIFLFAQRFIISGLTQGALKS